MEDFRYKALCRERNNDELIQMALACGLLHTLMDISRRDL